jgi:arylsulfatase A-like enzyme
MSSFRFPAGSRPWRRALAGVFTAAILAFHASAQTNSVPPGPRKPCILLVLADDLGWGDLGCYGQQNIKTPNLDRLAAQGMRFTSFYAGNSLSVASRTVLLTGKDAGHARNRGIEVVPLQWNDATVAEVLKGSGYATLAVGNWALGDISPPGRKGFDDWLGFLNESDAPSYYPTLLSRTSSHEDHLVSLPLNLNGKKGKYADDFFCDAALNFLTYRNPEDFNYHRPWFAYLPFTLPYASLETGPPSAAGAEVRSDGSYADLAWSPAEKTRAAMITLLDDYVGRLLDKLAQLKNEKNTIVIFTSATGPENDPEIDPRFFNSTGSLRGAKHDLYEGGIRVPLIVRWPLQIRPGAVSDLPCAACDILPTLAEAARASAPTNINGISFLPTLLGQTQTNRHDYLYWELHDHGFKQALRMGDWKAVRQSVDGPLELYNLKDDPGEATNVVTQNPAVAAQIIETLKTARKNSADWPLPDTNAPPAAN